MPTGVSWQTIVRPTWMKNFLRAGDCSPPDFVFSTGNQTDLSKSEYFSEVAVVGGEVVVADTFLGALPKYFPPDVEPRPGWQESFPRAVER